MPRVEADYVIGEVELDASGAATWERMWNAGAGCREGVRGRMWRRWLEFVA